jgi:TRAP-type C4-dicarboxylate transport system permease small subunit
MEVRHGVDARDEHGHDAFLRVTDLTPESSMSSEADLTDSAVKPPRGLAFGGLRVILATSVVLMMLLTFVDVLGRYVFNAPIGGASEITQFLLAITVFSALPIVTWQNGHVVVTLFGGGKGKPSAVRHVGVSLVIVLSLALMAYVLWREAGIMEMADQVTGFLQWPYAPLVYALCLLTLVTLLMQIVRLFMSLRR